MFFIKNKFYLKMDVHSELQKKFPEKFQNNMNLLNLNKFLKIF